jgi:hypothetical protein
MIPAKSTGTMSFFMTGVLLSKKSINPLAGTQAINMPTGERRICPAIPSSASGSL